MKNFLKFFILASVCLGYTGCFFVQPAAKTQKETNTVSISQMLVKRWRFQQAYNVVNSRTYDVTTNSSYWIEFYSNGTCYENGILGTGGRRQLRWSVSGNQLTIRGNNLSYGELSGSEVVYTIESVSDTKLQLSRWNGRKQNGSNITRRLIFSY